MEYIPGIVIERERELKLRNERIAAAEKVNISKDADRQKKSNPRGTPEIRIPLETRDSARPEKTG